jgi:hypothetical protein
MLRRDPTSPAMYALWGLQLSPSVATLHGSGRNHTWRVSTIELACRPLV